MIMNFYFLTLFIYLLIFELILFLMLKAWIDTLSHRKWRPYLLYYPCFTLGSMSYEFRGAYQCTYIENERGSESVRSP